MTEEEFHHEPTRTRLWAEAKRARVSEKRLLEAAKWALFALNSLAAHPHTKDDLRAGMDELRAAIAEVES